MTWREQLIIKILLIVARIIARENAQLSLEIKNLSNHISFHVPKAKEAP